MAYTDPVGIYIHEWCMALQEKLRSPALDKGTNADIQTQAAKRISTSLRIVYDPAMNLPNPSNGNF